MVDPMPLRCEIFEMMREYVGANLAKKVRSVYKELHADHETGAADNK